MMPRTQSSLRILEKMAYRRRFAADSDHTSHLDAIALHVGLHGLLSKAYDVHERLILVNCFGDISNYKDDSLYFCFCLSSYQSNRI